MVRVDLLVKKALAPVDQWDLVLMLVCEIPKGLNE
jgi:hypothetical protein